VQRTDRLLTYVCGKQESVIKSPGYILNRSIFDASLAEGAKLAGAHLWLGTRAISHTGNEVQFRLNNGDFIKARGQIIIGADGPLSTVGQWMKSSNTEFMAALQWRMPLGQAHSSTDIYLEPQYRGGYAWLFPRGREANVGVGVKKEYYCCLPQLIKHFTRRLIADGVIQDDVTRGRTGGLIPVGGPLNCTCRDNMLLCGDAAGLTHAVTGGGIMNALVSGMMAGETAARAVQNRDLNILNEYQAQWTPLLGGFLQRAFDNRQIMDREWTLQPAEFKDMAKRTWIGLNI
jgi:flavin-dependent dehydrogenase